MRDTAVEPPSGTAVSSVSGLGEPEAQAPPPHDDATIEADEEGDDDRSAEEVPLPTLTLARLALSQGDYDLAQRTLFGLLDRVPDSTEARRLLEEIELRRHAEGMPPAIVPTAVRKVTALRQWLDAIKLAAERRAP